MFYVGQKVVCVDADPQPSFQPWVATSELNGLKESGVYTVARVGDYRGVPVLWLAEIRRPIRPHLCHHGEPGYNRKRFRPAVSTDISIFTAMLNPAPRREAADA
jgi:hypothetical protein